MTGIKPLHHTVHENILYDAEMVSTFR